MKMNNNSTMEDRGRGERFAEKFYKSFAWKKCKEAYLNSVGRLCERCAANGNNFGVLPVLLLLSGGGAFSANTNARRVAHHGEQIQPVAIRSTHGLGP